MKKKYAFIDEFGSFGYNFESQGCSTHFIITAIIVDEEDLIIVSKGVEEIRKRFFQKGEMKSSQIGKTHKRRKIILSELKKLPFKIFSFVCDKRKIYENSGLRYKRSFYKFLNNIVYQELRTSFSNLTIIADELGGNDYLSSFAEYVKNKEVPLSLFDESLFRFDNSKHNNIIQVADVISGTLAYHYDEHKKANIGTHNYKNILENEILRIETFPKNFETFNTDYNNLNPQYNKEIAEICYRKAKYFVETHQNINDEDVKQQIAVINYLLFRFMNKSPRNYIPTKELINQLEYLGYKKMSIQTFRNKIIAKLRDNEVIISSSSGGYKIPSTEQELYNFVNHGKNIIMPMLSRLKKCNDVIKMGTNGKVDLFQKAEYENLSHLIIETN